MTIVINSTGQLMYNSSMPIGGFQLSNFSEGSILFTAYGGDSDGAGFELSILDDQIIAYLHRPIYYSILFVGLTLTMEALSNIPESVEYILLGIFKSILSNARTISFPKI